MFVRVISAFRHAKHLEMPGSGDWVVVEFPLRGEWTTPNTPARRIPSHGTDMLGQRYAYDFVHTDPAAKGMRFYRPSPLPYLFQGVDLEDCFGWGEPIYSPVEGLVIQAADGWPERQRLQPVKDLVLVLKNGVTFHPEQAKDLRSLAGNHLIIETDGGFAFLTHARTGSLRVSTGDRIQPGRHLADVGHSGNSTAPHLHFHLMDRPELLGAQGVPCCFREYEVFEGGEWTRVANGIPKHTERIRAVQ
jgi:murein DD-endopeptidase MepM/ murein hydrolase activator NlpD